MLKRIKDNPNKQILLWLMALCLMVFCIILVGGITRLTDSGLSMVDWRPLMGTIPPITDLQWQHTFENYQQFPQFKSVNQTMTLSEFKWIFFWEYSHRLLGRVLGILFLIPYIYFSIKKKIPKNLNKKLLFCFILGGIQGLLGWYMVQSGLVNIPRVSHFRLTAHLSLALFLFCYMFWLFLDLLFIEKYREKNQFYFFSKIFTVCIAFQIILGAFMAGLRAGRGYNTFPKMNGEWIPQGLFGLQPWWQNFFFNTINIQFMHRSFGCLLVLAVAFLFVKGRGLEGRSKSSLNALGFFTIFQYVIGV